MNPAPVSVTRVTVHPDRLEMVVQIGAGAPLHTSPGLIERLLPNHPHLLDHACRNGVGPTFGAVANRTPLPHLLEHLVVDIQARNALEADSDAEITFVGTSEWLPDRERTARVRVSMASDVAAFAALDEALERLNAALAATGLSAPGA